MLYRRSFLSIVLATGFLTGCGNNNTPLDADTRSVIDSIANHQISVAQKSNDSLCKVAQTTVLPQLVDSIKKERLREIEAQLKTIPR